MSRAGRIIGVLIILQMVGSGLVNFALRDPAAALASNGPGCNPGPGDNGDAGRRRGDSVPDSLATFPDDGSLDSFAGRGEPGGHRHGEISPCSPSTVPSGAQNWAHYLAKIFDGFHELGLLRLRCTASRWCLASSPSSV
jgi:hypothetical protein